MKHHSRPIAVYFACLFFMPLATRANAEIKSTSVPRYDAAVAKAIAYLKGLPDEKIQERDRSLVAYALLKAGVPQSDPLLASGIALAKQRAMTNFGPYHPTYTAAVDAMLLADSDPEAFLPQVQAIANRIQSFQCPDGSWSDVADGKSGNGDVSLVQYCVLALWAAQRIGGNVNPIVLDRAGDYLVKNTNSDGGWRYRPGTNTGPEGGRSSHNMTLAGVGTTSICRLLLYNIKPTKAPPPKKFGVLEVAEDLTQNDEGAFGGFKPTTPKGQMDKAIDRGMQWNRVHFEPVPRTEFQLYFYYTLERAAALVELDGNWFTTYGDALLTLQQKDGHFSSHSTASGPAVGTSFAILYFMKSTQQILKQYGGGIQVGGKDPTSLFGSKDKKKKELGPLDELLGELENVDFGELDNMDEIVEKVQYGSKEELIGQVDKLKILLKSPEAEHRRTAYFALGRTGNFDLIPDVLKGLRDPNLDVNVEALRALRYIARKPNGLGLPTDPLAGQAVSSEEQKIVRANNWRTKAYRAWGDWYRKVRPYEEGGGLDEIELLGPSAAR